MKNISKVIKFILPWAISFSVLFLIVKKIDTRKVVLSMLEADVRLIIIALVVSIFSCVCIAVERYRSILRLLGCNLTFSEVMKFKLGSYPLVLLFPLKSGELLRAIYLNREHQLSYEDGVKSIIAGYLLRILPLGTFFLIGLSLVKSSIVPILFLLTCFVLAAFFVKTVKVYSEAIFYSFVLDTILLLNFWIIFNSFGIKLPIGSYLCFVPVITVISSLPVSIAGVGVREGLVLLFFSNSSIPAERFFTAGFMVSLINDVLPAFIGLYFLNSFVLSLLFGGSYLERRQKSPILKYKIHKRAKKILQVLKKYGNSGMHLLDIGSADGKILSMLNKELKLARAVGVEPSDELRLANKDENIEILSGSGEELPFGDEEFDVVTISSVIEHVKDADRVMKESYRVLKKRGLIVMTAVNPFFDKIATFLGLKPDDHLRTYNLNQLKKLFNDNKFQIKLIERFGPLFYTLVVGEKN